VERIYASESSCPDRSIPISQANLQIHVFQPYSDDSYDEYTGGGDDEEVVSATVCELPSRGLEGLWESLIYSDGVKSKLLDYIYATISFGDAGVDCTNTFRLFYRCGRERHLTICALFWSHSQRRVMEQSPPSPRTSRDGQNFAMSRSRSETFDSACP
jgi:hypothetical protein